MSLRRAWLAGVVISAPALAVAVTAAAMNTPGYSAWRDTVSRLGSPGQPWAAFVRIALISYGLLILAGSRAVSELCRSPSAFVTSLRIYACCAVIAGVAPKDLPGAGHTSASELHVVATIVGGGAVVTAMALVTVTDASRLIRVLSAAAAVAMITASVAFRLTWGSQYYGAIERAVLVPSIAWLSAMGAIALSDAARRWRMGPDEAVEHVANQRSDRTGPG